MRHTQVLISVLLLLLPAAVSSFPEVHGVVGHPVTLPCSYPVPNGISSMCWGRGECRDTCGQTLIWTDGHRIYYQTSNRYQLKGQNLEGHVSLTIKNVTVSDSGLYCCRVEMKGPNGVQKLTISLQVQPEIPTSPPRGHTTITTSTTTSTRLTGAPKSTRISTSTPLPPSDTLTPKPDWNSIVTSSDHPWNNHTEVFPTKIPLRDTTKITYVGISIAILLLLLLASVLIFAKYCYVERKMGSLSLVDHIYKIKALQNTVVLRLRGKTQAALWKTVFMSRVKSQLFKEGLPPAIAADSNQI